MIRSRQPCRSVSFQHRVIVGLSVAALLQGCALGAPRLRPGSNITLPQAASSVFMERLLRGCDSTAVSTHARAGDVVECRGTKRPAGGESDPRPIEGQRRP